MFFGKPTLSSCLLSQCQQQAPKSPEAFGKCFRHKPHKHWPLISLPDHENPAPLATRRESLPGRCSHQTHLVQGCSLCHRQPAGEARRPPCTPIMSPFLGRSTLLGPDLAKINSHLSPDPAPLFPKGSPTGPTGGQRSGQSKRGPILHANAGPRLTATTPRRRGKGF